MVTFTFYGFFIFTAYRTYTLPSKLVHYFYWVMAPWQRIAESNFWRHLIQFCIPVISWFQGILA